MIILWDANVPFIMINKPRQGLKYEGMEFCVINIWYWWDIDERDDLAVFEKFLEGKNIHYNYFCALLSLKLSTLLVAVEFVCGKKIIMLQSKENIEISLKKICS